MGNRVDLTQFSAFSNEISGRAIILILGGLLLAKSTHEIHSSLEVSIDSSSNKISSFLSILFQIAMLDIVFSLESVITTVGLVDHLSIMVIAVVISVVVMLIATKPRSDFVDKNPTIKMLALSFLMLIGFTLMTEGFDVHVPEDYLYFAMAFSSTVEVLNIRVRGPKAVEVKPITLSKKYPMIKNV